MTCCLGLVGYLAPVLLDCSYETCLQLLTRCRIVNVSEKRLFKVIDSIQLNSAEMRQLEYFSSL
jgi:hypothetical protein